MGSSRTFAPHGHPGHYRPCRAASRACRDLHQVWWPQADQVKHDDAHLPAWHEPTRRYLDPATGVFLPTWDEALDAIGADDEPLHTVRYGPKFDAKGVLPGSRDTARRIGHLLTDPHHRLPGQ